MARTRKATVATLEPVQPLDITVEANIFPDVFEDAQEAEAEATTAEEIASALGLTGAQLSELLPELGFNVDPSRIPLEDADRIVEKVRSGLLMQSDPPQSQQIEVITVEGIASQTGLNPDQVIGILKELKIEVAGEKAQIPMAIASQFFDLSNTIKEKSESKLAALPSAGEGNQPSPEEEQKSLSLTFSEAKTIAQTNRVSLKAVFEMTEALKRRSQELAIQEGYFGFQELETLRNVGKTLAAVEAYRRESADLNEREEKLSKGELDAIAFADSLGIDVSDILKTQENLDEEAAKKRVKQEDIADRVLRGEKLQEGELPSPLALMRGRLQALKN